MNMILSILLLSYIYTSDLVKNNNIYFGDKIMNSVLRKAVEKTIMGLLEQPRNNIRIENFIRDIRLKVFITIYSKKHTVNIIKYDRKGKRISYEIKSGTHSEITSDNYKKALTGICDTIKRELPNRRLSIFYFTFCVDVESSYFNYDNLNEMFIIFTYKAVFKNLIKREVRYFPFEYVKLKFSEIFDSPIENSLKFEHERSTVYCFFNSNFKEKIKNNILEEIGMSYLLKLLPIVSKIYLNNEEPGEGDDCINCIAISLFNIIKNVYESDDMIETNSSILLGLLQIIINKQLFKKKLMRILKRTDNEVSIIFKEFKKYLDEKMDSCSTNEEEADQLYEFLVKLSVSEIVNDLKTSKIVFLLFKYLSNDVQSLKAIVFSSNYSETYSMGDFYKKNSDTIFEYYYELSKIFISFFNNKISIDEISEEERPFFIKLKEDFKRAAIEKIAHINVIGSYIFEDY
ncbi:hypothetical protein NGRA_1565 [Nosema granulosis]|uniref:Uncharacterized protein n=1 Tax=Nosema granulosis TaxID=83296 RepID=A0A9P6GZT3_9MICR|nr:hypothetical protein NGRA_1565 [Nosema granulosis]